MTTALLLSGGMDSIAIAYWQRPELAITVNYGQRSFGGELRAASVVAKELNLLHKVIQVDCGELGSGDLSDMPQLSIAPASEWWPYRNQLLLTIVGMKVIQYGIQKLMIGTVKTDSFHADGTSEFVNSISSLFSLQEGGLIVEAPAIELTTSELVRKSEIPMSLLAWSHSCHTSDYACGACRGCNKYMIVMKELSYEQN